MKRRRPDTPGSRRPLHAAGAKRLRLVALAVVAALVCLSLRVVRLPEREPAPRDAGALATLPPVLATGR
jgi:hypothetical protein